MKIPDNHRLSNSDVYTVKQIAEYLQISELTVRRALSTGDLIGLKFGNTWRLEAQHVYDWIRTKESKGKRGRNNDF